MKKLITLLIVLMMTMSVGFAYAECPCAYGYDLTTGTAGIYNNRNYLSGNLSRPPFGLGNGEKLCLHGNRLMTLFGQATAYIANNASVYLYDCVGYGELTNDPEAFSFPMLHIWSGAEVNIDGGFYTAQGRNDAAIAIKNEGTLILHDAVITGNPALAGNDFSVGENSVLIEKTENRIIVAKAPKIIDPTAEKTVSAVEGDTVTLKVEAKDWRPLTYQWFCNGKAISGADKAEYSFSAALSDDGNTYYCVVTNDVELSATSPVFELEVAADPDRVPTVTPVPPTTPELPATGDNASLALWMGMLLIAGAALISLRKKAVR